jgi:hypothetical protein
MDVGEHKDANVLGIAGAALSKIGDFSRNKIPQWIVVQGYVKVPANNFKGLG